MQAGHERGEGEDAVAYPVRFIAPPDFANETAPERVDWFVAGVDFDVVEARNVEDMRREEVVSP